MAVLFGSLIATAMKVLTILYLSKESIQASRVWRTADNKEYFGHSSIDSPRCWQQNGGIIARRFTCKWEKNKPTTKLGNWRGRITRQNYWTLTAKFSSNRTGRWSHFTVQPRRIIYWTLSQNLHFLNQFFTPLGSIAFYLLYLKLKNVKDYVYPWFHRFFISKTHPAHTKLLTWQQTLPESRSGGVIYF